jgi:acetylornithine deacetylase/succinyl-diaminopimelate desuccinylase-like protein
MSYKNYLDENKDRFISELIDLLKIPSVSADPRYKESVRKCAEKVKSEMDKAGLENTLVMETGGHPLVYGDKLIGSEFPTVIVYGHYDVQPPDPIDLWDSPPFDPVIKDGKIYARGAADDKGQFFMHVKAFEMMQKLGTLKCNVKFMIEGEEEVGSDHLGDFLKKEKDRFSGDVILISDTSIIANDIPSITVGLRGLSYVEVELTGPNRDLHSGLYGGGVINPLNELCRMIAKLHDENFRVTIPGFYDDVLELSDEERKEFAKTPFDLSAYKQHLDIEDVRGESGYSTLERTATRPTLDVNGIWGGYTGEGAKTVIPSKAFAKISMRLVPNQDYEKVMKLFEDYFVSLAPKGIRVKVKPHHGGNPVLTPTSGIAYQAASKAMESTFGKKPVPVRGGGSVPIVALFKDVLGLESVLMGFGLDSDAIHSPNEHFGIFNYLKGIETIPLFYENYYELVRAEKK